MALVFTNMMNLAPQERLESGETLLQKNATAKDEITFKDIKFIKYLGAGAGKLGFKAKIRGSNRLHAVKITGDSYIHLTDTETQMMKILNAPPTIPNIPIVELYIPNMPNPFKNRTYLKKILRVDHYSAKWLSRIENISVTVRMLRIALGFVSYSKGRRLTFILFSCYICMYVEGYGILGS